MNPLIKYIDSARIQNKKVLLRVDFNVSLHPDHSIADDARIRQSIPTIKHLLNNKNILFIISHLDRPKKRDPKLSLKYIIPDLQGYLDNIKVVLINDFLTRMPKIDMSGNSVYLLENIRFYKGEQENNDLFSKKLASLADVYVNDAFGVSHRSDASVVGVPKYIPGFGGLLLKREITMISKVLKKPKMPVVGIIGGAKIQTKMHVLNAFTEITDSLVIGGGLANTFLCAQGIEVGKSYCQPEAVDYARKLLYLAAQKHTKIVLPQDVVVGDLNTDEGSAVVKNINEVTSGDMILDIGPKTQAEVGALISRARTIIWNGPVGYIEHPAFRRGTDFIYYAIAQNSQAFSLVGGGDTLAAISKKEYLERITHISTGGGAMLTYIEKKTLPGIEVLESCNNPV